MQSRVGRQEDRLASDNIRARGGKITREPGPMMHGDSILAFVEDPDGYKIELLSPSRAD